MTTADIRIAPAFGIGQVVRESSQRDGIGKLAPTLNLEIDLVLALFDPFFRDG